MKFCFAAIPLMIATGASAEPQELAQTETIENAGQRIGVVRCDKGTFVGGLRQAYGVHCGADGYPTAAAPVEGLRAPAVARRDAFAPRPAVVSPRVRHRHHAKAHAGPFDFLFRLVNY